MAILGMRDVRLAFGGDLLLDGVDLNIEQGDRMCLVGRNGTGKSTLLKLLQGEIAPDGGEITRDKGIRTAYMPQQIPADLTGTVRQVAAQGAHHDDHMEANQVIGRVLSHLHLDPNAESATLSGGQKRRVLLARALTSEPDVLLLDEPTNHLDVESICWMEDFLLKHCKTIVFVTHDRTFLRHLANRIADLDRGRLAQWTCDYDTFLARKADLIHDETVTRGRLDRKLAREEVWIRQGIKARRTRDEGRVRALVTLREERRARRYAEGQARLRVQQGELSGHKVISVKGVTFAYENAAPLVKELDLQVMRGDRVGVIGPNGSGKTTLLKLLTAQLKPTAGEVTLGTKLQIAYFDQHRARLNDDETVAENVGQGLDSVMIDGKARHVISYLQDFLFTPDRANSPVSVLSGGERNRLLLAMLFANPSNLLVMDEPTNDLDVETLELLEEQLAEYRGTVLMVSHDRAFLDNVVTSVLVMQPGGTVGEYIGGYEDWKRASAGSVDAARKTGGRSRKAGQPKAFGYMQNRELNALPKKIEKLEAQQQALHFKMADGEYFRTPPDQLTMDREEDSRLAAELEAAYDRWEELETLRADAQGQ